MNKEQGEQEVQGRANYLKPKVELFRLGENLNFLKIFSAHGELEQYEGWEEIGVDENDIPIGDETDKIYG